jgi:flagellar basal body-associated protein FliL
MSQDPQPHSGQPDPPDLEAPPPAANPTFLTVVVVLVLLLLFVLIGYGFWMADKNTRRIDAFFQESARQGQPQLPPNLMLAYLTSSSDYEAALFVKSIALVTAYVLVVLGCLFVLQGTQAFYRLGLRHGEIRSALQTSSPGLVLITLGCALVVFALFAHTTSDVKVTGADATEAPRNVSGGPAD